MRRQLLTGIFITLCICIQLRTAAQNVGVGTNTPEAKLHVNGDLKLQYGSAINEISNDANLNPGSSIILPTQSAVKNYILSRSWLPSNVDTTTPYPFTTTTLAGTPVAVAAQGNYVYTLSARLSIFDATDPARMVAKGFIATSAAKGLFVKGNYAYVVSGTSTATSLLSIYDISDPNTIVAKGTTNVNLDRPIKVQVQGNYAYVLSYTNTSLCIFDVSNPANIVATAVTTTNITFPTSLFVKGNFAYVTSSQSQGALSIYDISDPYTIIPRATTAGTGSLSHPLDVFVNNNYAYVVTDADKLTILDVSNPDNIIAKGTTGTNILNPMAVSAQGNVAYVVSRDNNKLALFDVSNPDNIVAKASTTTNLDMPSSLFVNGSFIYVTANNPPTKLCPFYYSANANVLIAPNGGLSAAASPWQAQGSNVFRTGNVGIGITNPLFPLEVGISSSFTTSGSYGLLTTSGASTSSSATSLPVSIKTSGTIMAPYFTAISDERVKRNIVTSASQKDLETLKQIRITDYQYKDSVYKGNEKIKGVIAQELQHVLPQAVHTTGDYVPDIYCLGTATEYNEKDKTLKISLCKPHQLKVGDKVKAFAGDGEQEQFVVAVNDASSFTLGNWQIKQAGMNPLQKIFVWGKWVDDFHTVDYNQVFALGISAIQQLAKENEEQQKINQSLQQQIDELKKLLQSVTK